MSKKIIPALAIFFIPILALSALTQTVQKDVDKDLTAYKKQQPVNYQSNKENNEQIMKYIRDSTKGNKIDFFSGLESEMKNMESIKNQNISNDNDKKVAAANAAASTTTTTPPPTKK